MCNSKNIHKLWNNTNSMFDECISSTELNFQYEPIKLDKKNIQSSNTNS